jgi:hypothetical protein
MAAPMDRPLTLPDDQNTSISNNTTPIQQAMPRKCTQRKYSHHQSTSQRTKNSTFLAALIAFTLQNNKHITKTKINPTALNIAILKNNC